MLPPRPQLMHWITGLTCIELIVRIAVKSHIEHCSFSRYIYIYMYTSMSISTHTYIYIYIYMYTHPHTLDHCHQVAVGAVSRLALKASEGFRSSRHLQVQELLQRTPVSAPGVPEGPEGLRGAQGRKLGVSGLGLVQLCRFTQS